MSKVSYKAADSGSSSSSEEDQYIWDTNPGDLSFVHDPSPVHLSEFEFGELDSEQIAGQGSTADWPARPTSEEFPHYELNKSLPRNPNYPNSRNSSTDQNFLEIAGESLHSNKPALTDIVESNEDSVFEDISVETNQHEMPPQVQRVVEDFLKKFKRSQRNWKQNYDRLKEKGSIHAGELEDMKLKRNDLEEIADDVFDNVEEDSDIYNDMLAQINMIREQMSDLYSKDKQSQVAGGSSGGTTPTITDLSAPPSVADPDVAIDKEVKKLQSVLDFHNGEVNKLETKLNSVILVTPEPTVETVKQVKELLEKSKLVINAAEEIYLK